MASPYTLHIHREALDRLYHIDRSDAAMLADSFRALAITPRPKPAIQHEDRPERYSITIDNYIVDYTVDDNKRIITILFIG